LDFNGFWKFRNIFYPNKLYHENEIPRLIPFKNE